MWTVMKTVKKGKYIYAVVPKHPNSTDKGYVLEHRVIMENSLNRLLSKDEIVHHIDHNTHNNRIDNLQIMTRSEHGKHHAKLNPRKISECVCPECFKIFTKFENQTKHRKMNFCSRKCNGTYQQKHNWN